MIIYIIHIDKGEFNKSIRIDLGPSFKDEFLNKKTQQLILEYYENNRKEKETTD